MNAELDETGEARKLSFPFAKRHGVLVRGVANGVADTVCRPGVTPQTLAEVRRFVGVPLKLERVSVESFDSMLRVAYEAGSGAAMQMLEGLDDNTDLAHLAEDIPESSDLLESDDEAPIIRLINALLTQAVKENASDIHIEPYENRLVIRFRVDGVLPPAPGRQNFIAHRRARGRRASLHPALGTRRAGGAAPARQAGRAHRTHLVGNGPSHPGNDG
jgi:type II secretory ATPase GspE/PulE/Tfp pilus assembly ATPase PilB-like protein